MNSRPQPATISELEVSNAMSFEDKEGRYQGSLTDAYESTIYRRYTEYVDDFIVEYVVHTHYDTVRTSGQGLLADFIPVKETFTYRGDMACIDVVISSADEINDDTAYQFKVFELEVGDARSFDRWVEVSLNNCITLDERFVDCLEALTINKTGKNAKEKIYDFIEVVMSVREGIELPPFWKGRCSEATRFYTSHFIR